MTDRKLKDKAIDIKGGKYVQVSDRVNYFTDSYPNGSINTELVSSPNADNIVIKAVVIPDMDKPERKFTDYAQEIVGSSFINKTSAMENASTSAVGRALAYMGIGVLDSIASVDEVNKANNRAKNSVKLATPKQLEWLRAEARRVSGNEHQDDVDKWITEVLTVPPEKIPVFKIKDAVDKVKSLAEQSNPNEPLPDIEVTDQDIQDMEAGKLPY